MLDMPDIQAFFLLLGCQLVMVELIEN